MVCTCMPATEPKNMFLCQRRMNSGKYISMLSDVLDTSIAKLQLGITRKKIYLPTGQRSLSQQK